MSGHIRKETGAEIRTISYDLLKYFPDSIGDDPAVQARGDGPAIHYIIYAGERIALRDRNPFVDFHRNQMPIRKRVA